MNVRYVYAVATDPAFQGRGLASELLNYINERVGKEYEAVFLVPASKELFGYYARFGYETVCNKKVITIDQEQPDYMDCDVCVRFGELTAKELYEFREQEFSKYGYIRWDVNALDYVIREYKLCRGNCVKVSTEDETGSLFYYYDPQNRVLYVKETSLSQDGLILALNELAKTYHFEKAEVIVPASNDLAGNVTSFVMAYGDQLLQFDYANFIKD